MNLSRQTSAFSVAVVFVALPVLASAQSVDSATGTDAVTVFPHPDEAPFWVSGQINSITQAHPSFAEQYHDTLGDPLDPTHASHSFAAPAELASSLVGTLYLGVPLAKWTAVLVDVELATGTGLSGAFGLAGFTDLDVVRNPSLGSEPYLARAMVLQIIPLTEERAPAQRSWSQPFFELPTRRIELRAGKLSTVDLFDVNSAGGDSHLQFMNWTIDNNGAYDYAADTRGYTYGFEVEYQAPRWALRAGEMLMPQVANGINLDWDLINSRAENFELELRPHLGGRPGVVRLLAYVNHADMGSYEQALAAFQAGTDRLPDGSVPTVPVIELHRVEGRIKYGGGLNVEQELPFGVTVFGRGGWNDGKTESFAYTEVDNTVCVGAVASGGVWRRPFDRVGAAFVSNGLSEDHRAYLAAGGHGFLLGDGALTYGREMISEAFYTAHVWRGLFASVDGQAIVNPGYNQDRGPAFVGSLRVHLEL